jgi:aquaporin Z
LPGLRRYVLELVGTFFLTFTVLGAASQDVMVGVIAIGAAVTVLVLCGGHANPVLTLAAVVARSLPPAELLPYWAAQLVGALVGAATARLLVAAPAVTPLQGVGVATLLVVEAVFAFALCFVVLDGRPWAGGAAGLTVVAASAVLDPVAGSAFNPAPAFGLVVAGVTEWSTIWVYLVGCAAGGAIAGLLTRQARSSPG